MDDIRALGLDPGLANCGYAEARLLPDHNFGMEVVSLGVLRTKKSSAKKKVLAADDNFERARFISKEIKWMLDNRKIHVLCVEAMSFPRNSSAAAKIAMVWGIIAALSVQYEIPVIQVSPQQLKISVCNNKSASKEEIEAELLAVYKPHPRLFEGIPKSKREHAFDALGAINASLDSDIIRMLRRLVGSR